MCRAVFAAVALLPLLVLTLQVSGTQSCPRSCNCYQANEVHCTFRSLITIPTGLPAHTRRINLGFNSIKILHDKSLAGLKKVELLMLHSNDLHHLPDAAFRDMRSLQILKLSYNKLREISSSLTFSGLTSLLRLYLDHNLLQHIHPRALLQLPSLRLLRLQGNRLHQLHPHALCTLSLLNTYYFSTLRHLDLSNNSLTTLHKKSVATAPLLDSLVLQANPWSCDCRMNWLLSWSLAHPGLMKCPSDSQCPVCASPTSLQGQGLLDQTALICSSPIIRSPGKDTLLDTDLSEIQSSEAFKEPLGSVSLGLSDQQGNSIDLSCNISHSTDLQDIVPPPDLSWTSSSPLHLAVSLSLECPTGELSYEKLWRILAYYSETAAKLEREIMLSKAPVLAYRYKQAPEAGGYFHTGLKASVKARPQWLLQPAISIQLNRAQSNGHKVQLTYSTRVSSHPDPPSQLSTSFVSHQWVMISTTTTALAAVAGKMVELSCPFLSSGRHNVSWILPGGSKLNFPFSSLDGRLQVSASGLLIRKVQLSDAGIYYCVVKAGRDVDSLSLRLVVEESSAPYSEELSGTSVTGAVGEPVSLPCRISGSPEPFRSWVLPNGNVVRQGLAVSGGLTIHSNGSLSLHKPSVRDSGYYRCIAVNQYGSDSLAMQLILNSQHISPLETSFPRGPQSASGRSTKIRASLFHQVNEGSGDEEEQEKTPTGNRRQTMLRPNRRHPSGKLQRFGRVREEPPRRVGGPILPTEERRSHHQNRHRITTNKLRMDPKSWADILAKIRQKAANATNKQHISSVNTTVESVQEDKDNDKRGQVDGNNINRGRAQETGMEEESEESSADDTILRENQPQPIQPALTDTQAKAKNKINAEIESGTQTTEKYIDSEVKTEANVQTEKANLHTRTTAISVTQKELVTSNPTSVTNVLESNEVHGPGLNFNPAKTRAHNAHWGLSPNSVPNSRPQSPWNSRRKIGQRRRIIRPRIQPMTSSPLLSDPLTPNLTTDKTTLLPAVPTASHLAIKMTAGHHIKTTSNGVSLNPLPTPFSDTSISTSSFISPSLTSSSAHTDTNTDFLTHSAKIPQTQDFTFNSTPAPTQPNNVISGTHVPSILNRTFTHGIQIHTATQITIDKHTERPPSSEELESNVLDEIHFSNAHSFTPSFVPSASSATTTAAEIITTPPAIPKRAGYVGSTESTSTFMTGEETLPTTTTTTTMSPTTSSSTTIIIPISSTTRQSSNTPSTKSPLSSATSSTGTSITTVSPIIYTTESTTILGTSASSTTVSMNEIFRTSNPSPGSTTVKIPSTTKIISTKTAPVTTGESTADTILSVTTMGSSTKESLQKIPVIDKADPQVSFFPDTPNQTPTGWKNHGANFIPDSHSNRFHRPPASSPPVASAAPALRSRPRIANPHDRIVSLPANSTAWLTCEAEGDPKPSITWTKTATRAVMSIHSRAQRFEVLPNGTLVIQNVQLQDRGTYICSATSFLGRDRLLTTLDVWTRPPRMQLASSREVTIHQGGDVHLECQADGVPTPLLSWVLPDRSTLTSAVTSSSRINVDAIGTLHIPVTLPSDRGVYRCVASNSAGAASALVRVHVSSLPPVIQQPKEEHLLFSLGRPVYAHCSARGAPPPTLRWRIPDGTLVRPSQFLHGNLFVLNNGTLHISKVGPKDAGSYECTASNAVGTSKRTVRVKVKELAKQEEAKIEGMKDKTPSNSSSFNKDKILVIPSHPSDPFNSRKISPVYPSDRSRNLSISPSSFNSSSNSPPKINKTVKAYPSHFTDIKKANPSSVFSQSTVPTYNSKVSHSINSTRVLSLPADRKVSSVLQPVPISPFTKAHIVSTSPSTSTVNYGGVLKLYCSVTGNPTPNIIWRTPGKKLVDTQYSYDRRLKVHPNGTLSVQTVTEKDGGDYLCIARNKVADDYRLLRVNVATKPAKIEPKQSLNHMVSFGKSLKMDCQASGLPPPAVHWSLPDGTMVSSVENNRNRPQKLTVFDNGTLLVPVVGVGEEGIYICYAENQAGQDTMKVKVKAVKTAPPTFADGKSHSFIKVRQGETATIPCWARGDPAPTVSWFSPARRVIPQSLGFGYYSERIAVISDGTLKVRSAQKTDTGNYTCQARNTAGMRNFVVSLEVETSTHGPNEQVSGQSWSINREHEGSHDIRSGDVIDNKETIKHASKSGITSKPGGNNGRIQNVVPNTDVNLILSGSNPALRSYHQNGFKSPVSGFTTQLGNGGIIAGPNRAQRVGTKVDTSETNKNKPSILSQSNSLGYGQNTFKENGDDRDPGTNNYEITAGRTKNDANINRYNSRLSLSRSVERFSSSLSNSGAGSTVTGHGFSGNSNLGRNSDSGISGSSGAALGVVTIITQRAIKGQTVLLPCPSQGFPAPRLSWLLPGNGMLPAPYYGSRLTVHRNGSLELRGLRVDDGGTFLCVVKSEKGEALIRMELEVSEPQVVARSQEGVVGKKSQAGDLLNQSSRPAPPLPHLQKSINLYPHPLNTLPSRSLISEPTVSTRTAQLVSTINGETLRLPCPTTQTQVSFLWTTPSGKVLSRGENGDSGRFAVHEDGTLIIKDTSVFDRGTYTCKVSSQDSSSVSVLTVPVIVIAYPPRITKGPSPVTYTSQGAAVELPCLTIATPRATVTWETPDLIQLRVMGQPRIYGNRYLSPQGSLVIQNPTHRDTGFYRCTAKNVIGVDNKATYLHVI